MITTALLAVIDWPIAINADNLSGVVVFAGGAILVITDKLVWHKRLEKVEEDRDFWRDTAIEALTTGAASGVKAAEVTADVISAIPDPTRGKG